MAADPMPDLGAAVTSEEAFDPAVKWFQKRLGMTRAQVDRMTLDARRKVFFVTGLSDLELIKSVQDSLARALEEGKTFEEWKAEVKEKKLFQGPEFTKRRLETIFRTNMQNAFATGRYMEMTSPAMLKRRPYWKFSAVRDGRTTSTCAAAHGTILPANHPWWKTHIPPLHFNCRSTIVPLSERRAKELGITKHPPPAPSALGFGNPPFGVPAAARDLPTEAQREAAEKVSEEVQTAVEERQNASSELTAAKHEKSVADRKLREAKKELIRAPQKDVPARKKDVEEAQKAAEAAGKHVEKAKKELEKADNHVEKVTAANEGEPRRWTLVPERLKRLAKGVAAPAVGLWKKILAVLAGVDLAAVGRGATVRSLGSETGSLAIGGKLPFDLEHLSGQDKKELFGKYDYLFDWWENGFNKYKGETHKKLTQAISNYKLTKVLNAALRGKIKMSSEMWHDEALLSKFLRTNEAPVEMVLFRGAGDLRVLDSLFPSIAKKIPAKNKNLRTWKTAIDKVIKSSGKIVGVKDNAFMSTSVDPNRAFKTLVRYEITVTPGQKGLAFIIGKDNRSFQKQREVVIERNRRVEFIETKIEKIKVSEKGKSVVKDSIILVGRLLD